ncbi:hypothetical protein AK812_SmicGene33053 [Symbiodinium microadriaticum]|uniref:Uncharacterized protein n=1 Tax=Symbiodinium microadriaticum TaxID=2951 RepID=A0A1Q9CSM0_SYMMI|nr:hypothetical protein AK812_SmicGene33053 [Symbiodinium microadriaticum]
MPPMKSRMDDPAGADFGLFLVLLVELSMVVTGIGRRILDAKYYAPAGMDSGDFKTIVTHPIMDLPQVAAGGSSKLD